MTEDQTIDLVTFWLLQHDVLVRAADNLGYLCLQTLASTENFSHSRLNQWFSNLKNLQLISTIQCDGCMLLPVLLSWVVFSIGPLSCHVLHSAYPVILI